MTRSTRLLFPAAFGAGLALLGWIAAGYLAGHLLALAVTVLVAAFYLAGALELHRFRRATATLDAALAPLDTLAAPPERLADWLAPLDPTLRPAVRARVEGERAAALPGPALSPFLAGLLVLLGMLGTFLGMVATLRGTGLALGQAGDLQALRDALAAPVQGLGLAFGTSVAGIAASAALGLMGALARRERAAAAHRLDAAIAGPLRAHSAAQRRDDHLALAQRQADALPALVERLDALVTTLDSRQQALHTQLLAQQQEAAARLAAQQQETASHLAAQQQAVGDRLLGTQQAITDALAASQQALADRLARTQDATAEHLLAGQQATAEHLVTGQQAITQRLLALQQAVAAQLQQQQHDFHTRADAAHGALAASVGASLQQHLAEGTRLAAATLQPVAEATLAGMARETAALHARIAQAGQQQAEQLAATLARAAQGLEQRSAALVDEVSGRLQASAEHLARHAAALSEGVDQAHARLQAELAARDGERLAAWAGALQATADTLGRQWHEAGAQATAQQREVADVLARTAGQMSEQAAAHARATIAEIGRLVQAAAEAPRAAAEVVAELRQQLSDSLARDNTLLDERARLLGTLGTLLDAVNHASTEQRAAVDQLVEQAGALLGRAGERFDAQLQAGAAQLADSAAQVTGSAVEVASLGEAFGEGVLRFGESNDKLVAQLERIEAALAQSMARSDDQLAYYVAQAREVLDLSILSQQQLMQELQQAAARPAGRGREPVGA